MFRKKLERKKSSNCLHATLCVCEIVVDTNTRKVETIQKKLNK